MIDSKGQSLHRTLIEQQRPHPLVAALTFAHQTNEIAGDGSQGASLNPKNGRLLRAGEHDAWMVGGHPDARGVRIPEEAIPGRHLNFLQALNHVHKVASETRSQPGTVAAGSWYSAEKDHIALDASTSVPRKRDAVRLMEGRDEDATFNLKTFDEVKNHKKAARLATEGKATA